MTFRNSLTERWKALLSQFQLSVIPFDLLLGGHSATLTFYEGDTPLQLLSDHTSLDLISIPEAWVGEQETWKMLRIDNFDEVGEEFMALSREMGVAIWDPVEVESEE